MLVYAKAGFAGNRAETTDDQDLHSRRRGVGEVYVKSGC